MNVLNRRRLTRSLALVVTGALMAAGSLVGAGTASADATTTVSGTVRNQAGAQANTSVYLYGGTVDAQGNYDSDESEWISLDAAGGFSVDTATAFTAKYSAYWLSFGRDRAQVNGVWYASYGEVPVTLGSTVNAVIAERPATDQDIDVVVAGVPEKTNVTLYVWDANIGWYWLDSDSTDVAGRVKFRGYKNGRYTLRISSTPTTYSQYLGGSVYQPESATAPGTFGTNADAAITHFFSAVKSATANGRVTWAAVHPTDATVSLLRWYDNGDGTGNWSGDSTVKVNPDGSFKFDALLPGETYSVAITSANTDGTMTHTKTWLGGSTVPPVEKSQIASFVATSGANNDLGVIAVNAVAGRINVGLNGFLAGSDINVSAYNITKGYTDSARTTLFASNGSKALEGLEPGVYRVSAMQYTEGSAAYFAEALNVVVTSGGTANVGLTAVPNALLASPARLVTKIDGARRVGETVTARVLLTKAPAAFASAVKYQYVWTDGKQILGTAPTLKLTTAMVDKTAEISVWVHASAPGYVSLTDGAYLGSDQPLVDPGLRPVPTKAPSISGKVGFGKKLTANPGSWSPAPTGYTYQWLRNGAVIKGATSKTYKPRRADAGKRISVRVTPVLAGHDVLAFTTPRTTALPKVSGAVKAKLVKKTIKAKSRAKVTFTVKSKGISVVTGKVTIKYGKKSKTVTLKAANKGKATVTLPKLKKGTYKVTVTYKGGAQVKKVALKKALTLKVK